MLPAVRRNPTAAFMSAALRYGDVVYLRIGSRRGFLITNPADVRHVLQDNARNYHKSPLYAKLRMSLGNGLLTSEDEFWLRQRRIAQPAFHRQRIAALASIMADAARGTAAEWESIAARGEPTDVGEEMMRLTRTVVLSRSARASGPSDSWTGCHRRSAGSSRLPASCSGEPSITSSANAGAARLRARICCPCCWRRATKRPGKP
jgi:hypothetical protein